MTLEQFRQKAHDALPHLCAGTTYFVDHDDQTVYYAIVWANKAEIAADEVIAPGEPRWPNEYRQACSDANAGTTIHFPRILAYS